MNKDHLTILWTNADPKTAEMMVLMYAGNAIERGWWKEVEIIVWGSTMELVATDAHIREVLEDVMATGVKVRMCRACARKLHVEEKLDQLGYDLDFMGGPLTDAIKGEGKLITI